MDSVTLSWRRAASDVSGGELLELVCELFDGAVVPAGWCTPACRENCAGHSTRSADGKLVVGGESDNRHVVATDVQPDDTG
jgi:hypothetical protein